MSYIEKIKNAIDCDKFGANALIVRNDVAQEILKEAEELGGNYKEKFTSIIKLYGLKVLITFNKLDKEFVLLQLDIPYVEDNPLTKLQLLQETQL